MLASIDMITWFKLFAIGMGMGILVHTKENRGLIKFPYKNKKTWNPGFLKDMLWGGAGAVAMVLMAAPADLPRVYLMAIIGGAAGQRIIMSRVDRVVEDNTDEVKSLLNKEPTDEEIPLKNEK